MLARLFLDHPKALGMSWAEHGAGAVAIGARMVGAGIACIVHAAVPGRVGVGRRFEVADDVGARVERPYPGGLLVRTRVARPGDTEHEQEDGSEDGSHPPILTRGGTSDEPRQ